MTSDGYSKNHKYLLSVSDFIYVASLGLTASSTILPVFIHHCQQYDGSQNVVIIVIETFITVHFSLPLAKDVYVLEQTRQICH